MKKGPTGRKPFVIVTFPVTKQDHEAIRTAAGSLDMTISALARAALREFIQQKTGIRRPFSDPQYAEAASFLRK